LIDHPTKAYFKKKIEKFSEKIEERKQLEKSFFDV